VTIQSDIMKDPNMQVVMGMVNKWHELDVEGALDAFTDDGVFHSMMNEPIRGRDALSKFLSNLFANMSNLTLEIKSAAINGNTVILERFDEWTFNSLPGSIPVVGVYVVEGWKVKEWREYYDRTTILEEMGLSGAKKGVFN